MIFPKHRNIEWFLAAGLLAVCILCLRLNSVSGRLYDVVIKDPPRISPQGSFILAPADGTVLYVKPFHRGTIPPILKHDTPVAVGTHLRTDLIPPLEEGFLIGIYMQTNGVHINRSPVAGKLLLQEVFNGPHLNMTQAEKSIILNQLIPGWIDFKKLVGLPPFQLDQDFAYVHKSARESLVFLDTREKRVVTVRIADFYVGKILTWVKPQQVLKAGDKIGMITWGSQTDLVIENSPRLQIRIQEGDHTLAGETIIATF